MFVQPLGAIALWFLALLAPHPNVALTPGDVFAGVGPEQFCVSGYASDARNVSTSKKTSVYHAYGYAMKPGPDWAIDHLIPLEVGGSNDRKNLWPMPMSWKAMKDELEDTLHRLTCSGELDYHEAQRAIATDWYAAWEKYVERVD